MARPTYFFGNGRSEGNAGMKALLGGRGAHKCEMANLGLPVPPGFCITPKCLQPAGETTGSPLSEEARGSIKLALSQLEDASDRRFGNLVDPLLLSIEGQVKVPVNGFRGTITNIGLNDAIVQAWTRHASPHFVWDSYRRLISTFARAVRHLDMKPFEDALSEVKGRLNAQCQLGREHADCHIPTSELRDLVATYKELFQEQTGEAFPQEPERQLWEAVQAASCSWEQEQGDATGAVTVQSTIFSNYDFKSAVGVTFTGGNTQDDEGADSLAPEMRGKWLINAQSEDMGCDRIPQEVTQDASCRWAVQQGIDEAQRLDEFPSLEEAMPGIFAKLLRFQDIVENHFHDTDVHGMEFAIHEGRLWLLQTHTDEGALREHFFAKQVSEQSAVSMPIEDLAKEALPEPVADPFAEMSVEESLISSVDLFDDDVYPDPTSIEEAESSQVNKDIETAYYLSKVQPSMKPQALFQSPGALMWQALRRLGRKTQKETSLQGSGASIKESEQAATKRGLLPSGLALWQTALAGGCAAVACRGLGMSIEKLQTTKQMKPNMSNSLNLVRAFSLQGGLRTFMATASMPAGPLRAFPFGAVCCTLYTNLCFATPADDSAFCRLGCATSAVLSAAMLTQVAASQGKLWCPKMATLVPTLAIEMCTIDLVKNAALERGHDASPGVLVASGAVAGTVAQTVMHPLKALCREAALPAIAASGAGSSTALRVMTGGASNVFAGLGPAVFRSIPLVAMNSLVRVGMTTHFLSSLGH